MTGLNLLGGEHVAHARKDMLELLQQFGWDMLGYSGGGGGYWELVLLSHLEICAV